MINVKDIVYSKLSEKFSNLSDTYPQNFVNFPTVQYSEEENYVYEWTDDEEQTSYIRYRIDIWSNASTSQNALDVDAIMAELGFKRTSCTDVSDPSYLKHKMMRYEGIIDKDKEYINQE